jgi:prolipoprotein diacylglyceryltransferase
MFDLPTMLPAQSTWFGWGIVLGTCYLLAAVWRLDARRLEALALAGGCGVVGAMGARTLHVAIEAPPSLSVEWIAPWRAGFASFGLLGGAGLVALVYVHRRGFERAAPVLDVVVPAGFLALSIARLGCLANGCDFGAPTDGSWGLRYPSGTPVWELHQSLGLVEDRATWSAPTHPLPLYLAGGTWGLVLGGEWLSSTGLLPSGTRAIGVATGYLAWRGWVETMRDPHLVAASFSRGGWELHLNQVLALSMLVVLGVLVLARLRPLRSSTH